MVRSTKLFSCAQPSSLYCEENVFIHTSVSGQYELPLLPNDTATETFSQVKNCENY